MRKLYYNNKNFVDKVIFLLIIYVSAYVFLKFVLKYISPFAFGFFVSLIISPLVGYFQKHLKIKRGITTIFLIVIFILLIAVGFTALVNRVFSEARYMAEYLPGQLDEFKHFIYNLQDRFERWMTFLPDEFTVYFEGIVNELVASVAGGVGNFAKNVSVSAVSKIPGFMLNVFLGLISAFFFTRDKNLIYNTIVNIMPPLLKSKAKVVREGFLSAISAYVRAQLVIMSVIASLCILGLTIMKYPYAVLMGIVICIMDAMPMIGASLILWPWAAVCLITGNYPYAVGLLLINIACFLARQILEPKVIGQQIGVHPLLMLISMYVGLKVFGFAGLILGPIMIVTAKVIIKAANPAVPTAPEDSDE